MNGTQHTATYRWLGSDAPHFNTPTLEPCGTMIAGMYGGDTASGADQNNDACFLLADAGNTWEFATLISARKTNQSAMLLMEFLGFAQAKLVELLREPASFAFPRIQAYVIEHLDTNDFREQARRVYGESTMLLCARKGQFLWWLNIGTNMLYLLHPDFAQQRMLCVNQPAPYERIGRQNTFSEAIPAYASGVRHLRPGQNRIVLTTPALHTFAKSPFSDPSLVYEWFTESERPLTDSVQMALIERQKAQPKTGLSLIAWQVNLANTL